jgi:hypothetical protein
MNWVLKVATRGGQDGVTVFVSEFSLREMKLPARRHTFATMWLVQCCTGLGCWVAGLLVKVVTSSRRGTWKKMVGIICFRWAVHSVLSPHHHPGLEDLLCLEGRTRSASASLDCSALFV